MTEAMAKIVLANGSVMYLADEEARRFLKRQISAPDKQKNSINGAPVAVALEIVEKDGKLIFKHPDFKTRNFERAMLESAKVEIEAGNFTGQNKHTKTRFVSVEGHPVGENIVKAAVVGGFLGE